MTRTCTRPFFKHLKKTLLTLILISGGLLTNRVNAFYLENPITNCKNIKLWKSPKTTTYQNGFLALDESNVDRILMRQVPVANFNSNQSNSCSGLIQFTDLSQGNPTSWLWDFGDGSFDTVQNPIHQYGTAGIYQVSLFVSNASGSDSLINQIINVNDLTYGMSQSCIPFTTDPTLGFQISNVSFAGINNNSSGGNYQDFTCIQAEVYIGHIYTLNVTHPSPASQNCKVWIDYNNDGIFNSTNELVLFKLSASSSSAQVTIPNNADTTNPIRMRVIADYDLANYPSPCSSPEYGQCEDYSLKISLLNSPPVSNFTSNISTTCSGEIQFEDLSANSPNSWQWNFGDGNQSQLQNPAHTYEQNGTYTVSLITGNSFGNDTTEYLNFITVDMEKGLTPASCSPNTLDFCCNYGINQFSFNTIMNNSAFADEGYQDFSCTKNTVVDEGGMYQFFIKGDGGNNQDFRAWIDFNNDGNFTSNELALSVNNTSLVYENYTLPTNAVVNTYLRLRVISDETGSTITSCTQPIRGQVEDYGIYIASPDGIKENQEKLLKIYPNPVANTMKWICEEDFNAITVFDMLGKICIQRSIVNDLEIDLSNLMPGSYIAIFESEKSRKQANFIKN